MIRAIAWRIGANRVVAASLIEVGYGGGRSTRRSARVALRYVQLLRVITTELLVPREQLVVAGLHLAAPGLVSSAWPVSDRMRASCVA
jgi:hypothetical protein